MEKKEAMKILKDFYDKSALFSVRTALDTIIPELKEPEDERIRKEIIAFIKKRDRSGCDYNYDLWIAWLEKQGEQTPAEEYNIAGIGSKNAQGKLAEMIKNLNPVNKILEQNPAWSEEDENNLTNIRNILLGNASTYGYAKKYISWVKALKERVQPKQEWSEEDKGNLLDVKCIIDEVWNNQDVREEIDHSGEELESLWHWLDNIWQRVEYPQNTWKPSDEQMERLKGIINNLPYQEVLYSLYQDLKKLKE